MGGGGFPIDDRGASNDQGCRGEARNRLHQRDEQHYGACSRAVGPRATTECRIFGNRLPLSVHASFRLVA